MPPQRIKYDVFGRLMQAERSTSGWRLFRLGSDGKRSPVTDTVIPDFVSEHELDQYLADVFHEWATSKHPAVSRVED